MRCVGYLVLGAWCLAAVATAQPTTGRTATTAEALETWPVFFHGKQVAVRRDVEPAANLVKLANTAKPIFVEWSERPNVTSNSEIRGEFWDIGRLDKSDPRLPAADLPAILDYATHGQWPAHDQAFIILKATSIDSPLPDQEPTIRAMAVAPDKYIGKGVTVTGRFRGANLFADLPSSAGTKGRYDFVLQSADAAIWVSGVRPRGKGFDLDINSRMDAGRWLQVAGTMRRDGPLAWIEATSLAAANAPAEAPVTVTVPPPPPEPPPQVIFTAPGQGETDVERTGTIRIQFSRDMDPRSFRDHIRISYAGPGEAGAPSAALPQMTIRYVEGTRALEIKPATALDRFRPVKVDLLEGILSNVDNKPLAPWSLTFTTGS
jgi:hypothetical protein